MMWPVESADSHSRRPTAQLLANNVLKNAKPHSIVLMHDGGGNHSTMPQALRR
ncbi:MAG: hypothetical protein KME08_05180 [Aphanothece sp. CMT-3BRIN-NPC111]|nr:hypothetical protein [Aphanothece sp. CMT-3BRIN-NPC111]